MADHTEIVWCDSTFNPWIGCTKIGSGCDHCYAEADFDLRKHRAKWGPGNPRSRTSAANWKKPLRWNENACWFAQCDECGWRGESIGGVCASCHGTDLSEARRRVFCASLADVFDNEVPRQWRIDLFRMILDTPNLDWLLLTKRIGNAAKMLQDTAECIGPMMDANDRYRPLPNVWIGATVVNQDEADRDIPKLLAVPARVRFLSMEPLLGPVRVFDESDPHPIQMQRGVVYPPGGLSWVIVGGESGPKARPMHPDWVRNLRDQCSASGTAFLFKQWGEWGPNWLNDDGKKVAGSEWMDKMGKMGKKSSGRLLDGVQHDGYPVARP